MFRMVVGHTEELDPEEAARDVLAQCRDQLEDEQPHAGILLTTYDAEPGVVAANVVEALPDIELVGTTSNAEMSSVLGFQEDSVTLALFSSDSVKMSAGLGTGLSSDPRAAARRAVEEARREVDDEPRLCIALTSVADVDASVLLEALGAELGPDVALLGGGSSPRIFGDDTLEAYQLVGDRVVHDAVSILLFSGPLHYSIGVDAGWRPVGPRGRVTRSASGAVIEIDGKPALDFYTRYLGADAKPTPANPLAVFEGSSDDFYLRVPTTFDASTGAVEVAGNVPEGSTVQLSVAVTDEIFEGTRAAVAKAVKGFPAEGTPGAALLFSCAVRKLVLGTRSGTEFDITQGELSTLEEPVPIVGFYCMGEIAPIGSMPARYHNETMVAALLGTD